METLSAEEWCFFMFRRLMLVFICVTDELACSVEYCGADLWGWQMELLQLPIHRFGRGMYEVPPSGIMEWTLELEMVAGVATDKYHFPCCMFIWSVENQTHKSAHQVVLAAV